MVKRFLGVLTLVVIIVFLFCVTPAFAGATAKIKGASEVFAGETYSYNYTVSFSSCIEGSAKVTADGIFEICSGGEIIELAISGSCNSATYSKTVKVRVKSDAQPGQTGKITVKITYQEVDEEYNPKSGTIKKELIATVAKKSGSKQSKSAKSKKASQTSLDSIDSPQSSYTEGLPGGLESVAAGGVINLCAEQLSYLSKDDLLELKQKGAILNVDFGDYICTVDGNSIIDIPENFTQLDLSASVSKLASLSDASSNLDDYQIHFSHCGALPFGITISFRTSKHDFGDVLYLYHYVKPAGLIEMKDKMAVDENGYASFNIEHCSSYFLSSQLITDTENAAPSDFAADLEDTITTALLRAKALDTPPITLSEIVLIVFGAAVVSSVITAFICRGIWKSHAK